MLSFCLYIPTPTHAYMHACTHTCTHKHTWHKKKRYRNSEIYYYLPKLETQQSQLRNQLDWGYSVWGWVLHMTVLLGSGLCVFQPKPCDCSKDVNTGWMCSPNAPTWTPGNPDSKLFFFEIKTSKRNNVFRDIKNNWWQVLAFLFIGFLF